MLGKKVVSVRYNNGTDEDMFAISTEGAPPDPCVLAVWNGSSFEPANNGQPVPRREKEDYAAGGGGGVTYHLED